MTWSRNAYYSSPEWHALSRAVLQRDGFKCYVCGGRAAQADHVIARANSGSDTLDNLKAICQPCHRTKSASEGGRARAARMGTARRPPEKHPGLR